MLFMQHWCHFSDSNQRLAQHCSKLQLIFIHKAESWTPFWNGLIYRSEPKFKITMNNCRVVTSELGGFHKVQMCTILVQTWHSVFVSHFSKMLPPWPLRRGLQSRSAWSYMVWLVCSVRLLQLPTDSLLFDIPFTPLFSMVTFYTDVRCFCIHKLLDIPHSSRITLT